MAAGHSYRAARLVNTMQRTKVVQTAEKAAMEAVSKRVGDVAAKKGLLPILTQSEQIVAKEGVFLSRGAENVNAGVLLNRRLASQEIAGGHAFGKHASEFGFKTTEEMALHIENVLANPTMRSLNDSNI